jgi:hypothetical protein
LIANLLIDADQNKNADICLGVYQGIASYTVFTTIGGDDPIKTVRHRRRDSTRLMAFI